jgi:rubrerythrin
MKTFFRLTKLVLVFLFLNSCASKPVTTTDNLKAAFNGESTASAKYSAFADKARSEGLNTIAVMFQATSRSEAIHAGNHLKVLEKLGVKVERPKIGSFNVLSTAENIADAIKGETYEIDIMYPEFIAANIEKNDDADQSFTWALETEKKHQALYETALASVSNGGENSLPAKWLICPVCGNTYDISTVAAECDFCMTSNEQFLSF